ncbi:Qac-pB8 family quaternary ammonium compound efflux SMR transporter [Lampropedia aestuarii]|uniref:Qac-pB8 family quaternary ammonium compound efflux SMR transporter n=1 Tax=Lampropedia aestuarii TaxID=2562762 RepID=A0A4S5BZW8_9BURK|nr:SMR family transporter [Lampropedia aestuarii]THJ35668.1 Qac-pB8 family quaternary ammonium compound efflux SMR transporter [Lampropedia aestuarii]
MSPYVPLGIAIVCEVIATTALKSSEGFSRLVPTTIVVIGYAMAFYCLSLTLKSIPTGVAYAIWSGVGIVLISLVGWLLHKQTLDLPAILGIGLIMAGVLVINVFSSSAPH